MRSRSFWAGFSLGVATGAGALYAGLRVWANRLEPELTTSDWCPGIDPSEKGLEVASRLRTAHVNWDLCGDWQEHEPHLRATEPEYLADRDPASQDGPEPAVDRSPVCYDCGRRLVRDAGQGWYAPEQPGLGFVCPAKGLGGQSHRPYLDEPERRPSTEAANEPEFARVDEEPPAADFPDDYSGAGEDSQAPDGWVHHSPEGCHAQGRPHTGPCINVVNHSPWMPAYRLDPQAPLLDPEAVERWKSEVRRIAEDMGRALTPLSDVFAGTSPSTLGGAAQCDRDFPHSVHVWTGGVCTGIRTAGGASDA